MNIRINPGINPVGIPDKIKTSPLRKSGSVKDTFVRSAAAVGTKKFSLDETLEHLRGLTSFNGKQKFNEERLAVISGILRENPEKTEAIINLSEKPKIISSLVCEFAAKDTATLSAISELSDCVKPDGSFKFSPLELRSLSGKLEGDNLKKVGRLAQTPLDMDTIITIAGDSAIQNVDKLVNRVNAFAQTCEGMRRISFERDSCDAEAYVIRADMPDNGAKILLLDKNLDKSAIETVTVESGTGGRLFQVKRTVDFRNNTDSLVRAELNQKAPIPIPVEETRTIKSASGEVIREERYSLSDAAGTPEITYVYPDGREEKVSSGTYNPETGVKTVKKDMISLDGTRTQYTYEDDPQGNMTSEYLITDKNGNVLLHNRISFEKVSDNEFISKENDKSYTIYFSDTGIEVVNMTNGQKSVVSQDFMDGNREKLFESLRRMPAEEIISLGRTTEQLIGIDNTLQSTYCARGKVIRSGDNLFTILHEIGHAKDYERVDVDKKETLKKALFETPEINAVFEREKAAFNAAFPTAQREHISYFITDSEHKDGLQETIAETNALLNTGTSEDIFSMRSHYLQQYFPRTIAALSVYLD